MISSVVMYIVRTKRKYDGKKGKKIFTAVFLRESFRENGKVKGKTIANLSHLSPRIIDALDLVLKRDGDLADIIHLKDTLTLHEGKSVGALLLLQHVARQTGVASALGGSREGLLALWQVMARMLDQGSRLSSVRLGGACAVGEVLGLQEGFTEDDLYENLHWLDAHQVKIENALLAHRGGQKLTLCLYDVTSSYLEGTENELAAYGYNRDKKTGKMQIVIGLLCDAKGIPVSIQVFEGNTQDTKTMSDQIKKVAERFGAKDIVFVGDRGMIKSPQQEELRKEGFHFITALTKPQVETLLKNGPLQLSLFDDPVTEVAGEDGRRYVLRRNPVRAREIAATRASKLRRATERCTKENAYLREHPKADPEKAQERLEVYAERLKISSWVTITAADRTLSLTENTPAREEESQLDGCYVLVTDVPVERMDAETIHARYKDLALVERAFRTSKQSFLEVRPLFVRTEESTRGHLLVTMLSYLLAQRLQELWADQDCTVEEGLHSLSTLSLIEVKCKGEPVFCRIPVPRARSRVLLEKAGATVPTTLNASAITVVTKKSLQKSRKMALVSAGK